MKTIKVFQVRFIGEASEELSPPFATEEMAKEHIGYLESVGFESVEIDIHEIPITSGEQMMPTISEPITMPVYQGEIQGYSSTSFSPVYGNKADAEKYIEGEDGYILTVHCHEIKVSKHALAEQDKRTRHAIADAVAQHLLELGIDVPGIDGVVMNCNRGLTDG